MFKFLKSVVKKVLAAVMSVVGIGAASITTAVTGLPTTSNPTNSTAYEQSVSALTMCDLASEAYTGALFNLMSKYMKIKNNSVAGWLHIKEETFSDGLTYALWVNSFDPTTYVLVYTGTDQIKDMLDYIPMEVSKNRSSQMKNAATVLKGIDETIANLHSQNASVFGELEKLYITGHSLGGYLAMYIASDLVDSVLTNNANVLVGVNDIGWGNVDTKEEIQSKLQCVTIGAPGMNVKIKALLTDWQKQKIEANNSGHYTEIITQYIQPGDPVTTIVPGGDHLGRKVQFKKPSVSVSTKWKFFSENPGIIGAGAAFLLYHHLPWVYSNLISK